MNLHPDKVYRAKPACTQDLQQSGMCHFKPVYNYQVLAITWSRFRVTAPRSMASRRQLLTSPTLHWPSRTNQSCPPPASLLLLPRCPRAWRGRFVTSHQIQFPTGDALSLVFMGSSPVSPVAPVFSLTSYTGLCHTPSCTCAYLCARVCTGDTGDPTEKARLRLVTELVTNR